MLCNLGFQLFAIEYNPNSNGRRELLKDPPARLFYQRRGLR